MATLPIKLMMSAIGLVFFLAASPATAEQAVKHKKHKAAHTETVTTNSKYRRTDLFPAGPVYNGQDYIGDDPDPFIRSQFKRDTSRYGGEP